MIPGSASGSTSRNETVSRPKKRKRCTANAAIEPSTIAIVVEISAARTLSHSALRISSLWNVEENHFVERPAIGQLCTFERVERVEAISAIGNSRNSTISARPDAERSARAGSAPCHHSASNAPSRRATSR